MAARTTAVVSFAIFFIFDVGCSWRGAVANGGSWGGCVDNGGSCGVVLKLSNGFFGALVGPRLFFGFRPWLLGIGKQWVGTDQIGRSPERKGTTCRNTATPDCCSGSSAVVFMSTPMRLTCAACCARAASGHAAAAPPRSDMNRRRFIRSPRRRGRASAWEFRGQAPNVTLTVVGDLRSSNGEAMSAIFRNHRDEGSLDRARSKTAVND